MKRLDLTEIPRAYNDSALGEIRLPKALAKLDIERVLEAYIKPGDSKALSIPSTDLP